MLRSGPRWGWLVGLAVSLVSLTPSGGTALSAGCAADRPAVAYHSDGTSAAAPEGLLPCAVHTGYGGTEMHIRVAPNGNVVVQPADVPAGLPDHFEGSTTAGSTRPRPTGSGTPASVATCRATAS